MKNKEEKNEFPPSFSSMRRISIASLLTISRTDLTLFSVGFPVGREGLGAGREEGGGRRKKKGAEKGGGEGRIRWRDGLVLDAFGLFLFLLVWKDQERVSPLFSGSFRIFFG